MSEVLDDEDIRKLTGYKHKDKQIKALLAMSIPFLINPEKGKPIVTSTALNKYHNDKIEEGEPNWDG